MTLQEIMYAFNHDRSTCDVITDLKFSIERNDECKGIASVQKYFNCDEELAKDVFLEFKENIYPKMPKSKLTPEQRARNIAAARELLNKPKCPTCSSTNVKKISDLSKFVDTVVFDIYGTKRYKTFYCNNCGYEW